MNAGLSKQVRKLSNDFLNLETWSCSLAHTIPLPHVIRNRFHILRNRLDKACKDMLLHIRMMASFMHTRYATQGWFTSLKKLPARQGARDPYTSHGVQICAEPRFRSTAAGHAAQRRSRTAQSRWLCQKSRESTLERICTNRQDQLTL